MVAAAYNGWRSERYPVACFNCWKEILLGTSLDDEYDRVYYISNIEGSRTFRHKPSDHIVIQREGHVIATCWHVYRLAEAIARMKKLMADCPTIKEEVEA